MVCARARATCFRHESRYLGARQVADALVDARAQRGGHAHHVHVVVDEEGDEAQRERVVRVRLVGAAHDAGREARQHLHATRQLSINVSSTSRHGTTLEGFADATKHTDLFFTTNFEP